MIHGVEPGPLLMSSRPDIFWGVIVSMYIGNIFLVILNLPLIRLWVQLLRVPYSFLFPVIVLFCLVGVYTINNNVVEIFIMLIFGVVGYLMKRFGFEPAPFVMGLVLSSMMEDAFRQSLALSDGQVSIFFTRPLAAVFMVIGLLVPLGHFLLWIRKHIRLTSGRNDSSMRR
jgi:putative tricarboxylic transport membrane protein